MLALDLNMADGVRALVQAFLREMPFMKSVSGLPLKFSRRFL